MSDMTATLPGYRRYLPHNGEELPGAPPPDASSPELAERNAETFVRQMIVVQKREENQKRLPPLAPATPAEPDRTADAGLAGPSRAARVHAAPDHAAASPAAAASGSPRRRLLSGLRLALPRGAARDVGRRAGLLAGLRRYRPKRGHAILAALALVMVLRPLLLPLVILLTFWVGVIAYLTVGPDRWSEIIAGGFRRYSERNPERAERLRRKADAVAVRIDGLLDWLPERWADRLALPDFSQPLGQAQADARPDPFDRLAEEARRG